jgi:hypothetical protein
MSHANKEVVGRFRDRMEAYLNEAEATNTTLPDVEESADAKQRLEELGYIE